MIATLFALLSWFWAPAPKAVDVVAVPVVVSKPINPPRGTVVPFGRMRRHFVR